MKYMTDELTCHLCADCEDYTYEDPIKATYQIESKWANAFLVVAKDADPAMLERATSNFCVVCGKPASRREIPFRVQEIHGLAPSEATVELSCTHFELKRWTKDGRLPLGSGVLESAEWRSCGKGRRPCTERGYLWATIQSAKPHVSAWRQEHKAQQKEKQKKQARNRRAIKALLNTAIDAA
jgi:hypothetical protein